MRAQWQAKAPLIKQAWKQIVTAKIQMQAAALDAFGEPSAPISMLVRRIKSGDGSNIEAQAARYYWPRMMGSEFRRDTAGDGTNAMLNYGYTVLRAATARAVVAAGLHPTIGIFHSNRGNAFALADDLMEPFRPLVDCSVRSILARRSAEIDSEIKASLARLIATDLPLGDGVTPVSIAMMKMATSLGQSFEVGRLQLVMPRPPDPLTLVGLGR